MKTTKKQLQQAARPTAPKFQQSDGAGLMAISPSPESWAQSVQAAFGSKDPDFQTQVLKTLTTVLHLGEEDWVSHLNGMLAAMAGLGPRDELQAMLAAQMTAVHHLAMSRLAGVNAENQTPEASASRISQFIKLTRTFVAQIEAWQRLRGKTTDQKVTVRHIHIHEGAQAIVGAIAQTRGEGSD